MDLSLQELVVGGSGASRHGIRRSRIKRGKNNKRKGERNLSFQAGMNCVIARSFASEKMQVSTL